MSSSSIGSDKGFLITGAGKEYLVVARDALDRISIGTERLVQRQTSGVLTVSTSPDFAAKWLVHRLGRFAEAYPDIDLRISAVACTTSDFAERRSILRSGMAMAIGRDFDVARLCPEQLFAVCSPKLLSARQRVDQADPNVL